MRFKDQVHFIRRNMKKNRLRVFMTILATTMACAFLVVLSSVGFGIQKTITDMTMSQQVVTKVSVMGKEGDKPIKKADLEKYDHVRSVVERTQVSLRFPRNCCGQRTSLPAISKPFLGQ